MKIKLSKNQWEFIGKKTGWKIAQTQIDESAVLPKDEEEQFPIPEHLKLKVSKFEMTTSEKLLQKWIRKVYYLPAEFNDCPDKLKNDSLIKRARLEGWERFIKLSPSFFNDRSFPPEFKDMPQMKQARKEGWIAEVMTNPRSFDNLTFETKNSDLKSDPEVQKARIQGWLNRIEMVENKEQAIKYLPPELENNVEIQNALAKKEDF